MLVATVEVLGLHLAGTSVVLVENGLEDVPAPVLVVPDLARGVHLTARHHVDCHQDELVIDQLDDSVDLLRRQLWVDGADVVGRRDPALAHLTVDVRSELLVPSSDPDDVALCAAHLSATGSLEGREGSNDTLTRDDEQVLDCLLTVDFGCRGPDVGAPGAGLYERKSQLRLLAVEVAGKCGDCHTTTIPQSVLFDNNLAITDRIVVCVGL